MKSSTKFFICFELFKTFFKLGIFTFGGGYAMIPLLHRSVVEEKGWISDEEMLDMLAVAESTPGPVAINSATFVGYKVNKSAGAFFATLGVVIPSFLIISVVFVFLSAFKDNITLKNALLGIQAGVIVLIVNAALRLYKKMKKDLFNILLAAGAFLLSVLTDIDIVIILILCAVLGIFRYMLQVKKEGEK